MWPNLRATEVSQLSTVTTTTFWSEGPCGRPAWLKMGCGERGRPTHEYQDKFFSACLMFLWRLWSKQWGWEWGIHNGLLPLLCYSHFKFLCTLENFQMFLDPWGCFFFLILQCRLLCFWPLHPENISQTNMIVSVQEVFMSIHTYNWLSVIQYFTAKTVKNLIQINR